MIKNNINFFEYLDNFKKYSHIKSSLIKGSVLNNTPPITLVLPTYNSKPEVLKDAIDSALNQFGFDNFELLIIDNNPEFNCPTHLLIDGYKDNRILYYKNHQNIGMFGNWNRGIELARSNWVALLHDDDVMSPYFLKSCIPFLKENLVGIIKAENIKFSNSKELNFLKPDKIKLERLFLIDFIWGCEIGAPTNIIYNKRMLLETGGFNEGFFPAADYALAVKCVKKYKVYKIPTVLGGYRVGENESLSSKTMRLFHINRFYITSFIMKKYRFPDFVVSFIQSALLPKLVHNTNKFYNTNISFDYCKELDLTQKGELIQSFVNMFHILFRYMLSIRRKLYGMLNVRMTKEKL